MTKKKIETKQKPETHEAETIAELYRRLERDMLDSFDEELEMELDDLRFDDEVGKKRKGKNQVLSQRREYFKELLRLQGELVKLQDWVAHTGYRMIILFEGRDAAGKGGVIKRITQRLNPRVVRTVALPAPSDREKTPVVFPALCAAFPGCRRDRVV